MVFHLPIVVAVTIAVYDQAPPPPGPLPCPSCLPGAAPYPTTQPCAMAPLKGTPTCDPAVGLEARVDDIASRIPMAELPNLFSDVTVGVPSLNIPQYNWWSEALHGVSRCAYDRTKDLVPDHSHGGCCWKGKCPTSFPAGITTGTSFNKTLFKAIGTVAGTEARVMSNMGQASLTFWTPNVNIFRDPRWGRGQETPGEDPVVNADYAAGFVSGFQTGEDPTKIKASACCKHYAAYSMEDSDGQTRHNTNAVVTQQDLKDTYFPAFMSCANRGNASGIMCSYNAVNGVPSCASPELLTTNLREKWGFNGYVTSDCGAVGNVANDHNYTGGDPNKTALVTLGAGMDNDCGRYFGTDAGVLGTAIDSGYVPKATWMAALKNLFRVQIRLGMFDPDASQPYRSYGLEKVDTPDHRELALDAARQGMTLVKNNHNALPLKKGAGNVKIALVGPSANATITMQSNYHGTAPYFVSPADGVKKYSSAVTVVKGVSDTADNSTAGIAAAAAAAAAAEATVLVVGLSNLQEGEGHDRTDLLLPGAQPQLISAVIKAATAPVTLVVMSGGPVDLSAYKSDPMVGAILITGYPGQAGGQAIAETLFGDNNPAGRLTQTWYDSTFIDSCEMIDMNMRPEQQPQSPGWPVCPGRTYRFFTGTPVYKFGDGLSYTTFVHTKVAADAPSAAVATLAVTALSKQIKDTQYLPHTAATVLKIEVDVANVGQRDGDEVVLGYVVPGHPGQRGLPLRQLRKYERVFVPAGAERRATLEFSAHDFAVVDENGTAVVSAGVMSLEVGSTVTKVVLV